MKSIMNAVIVVISGLTVFPLLPAFAADTPLQAGGQMVVGKGHGPAAYSDGTTESCASEADITASVKVAEAKADQVAASQCLSGQADRVGEYRIDDRCLVWNSMYSGAFAQAPYICTHQ